MSWDLLSGAYLVPFTMDSLGLFGCGGGVIGGIPALAAGESDPFGIISGAAPDAGQLMDTLALYSPLSIGGLTGWCGGPGGPGRVGDGLVALSGGGGPVPSPAAESLAPARPVPGGAPGWAGLVCSACGVPFLRGDLLLECPVCHLVQEIDDPTPLDAYSRSYVPGSRGRLRFVGQEASYFQREMDSNSVPAGGEAQKKSVEQELQALNDEYATRGGSPFPLNVLATAAQYYAAIQAHCVKRARKKNTILASLVFRVCIRKGFARKRCDVADFMGLVCQGFSGFAQGDDFLREMCSKDVIDLDMNASHLWPNIVSTFEQLGIPDRKDLQYAVADLVQSATAKGVGHRSAVRSKVIGATWEVIRRAGIPRAMALISDKCEIRKNTIDRFIRELHLYHGSVSGIYALHGLDDASRPPAD